MTCDVPNRQELESIRKQLDRLAAWRLLGQLSDQDAATYEELAAREAHLLNIDAGVVVDLTRQIIDLRAGESLQSRRRSPLR